MRLYEVLTQLRDKRKVTSVRFEMGPDGVQQVCQIHRTPFQDRGPEDVAWARSEHVSSVTYSMLLGKKKETPVERTQMGGVAHFVDIKRTPLVRPLPGHLISDAMRWGSGGTAAGSGKKFLVASRRVLGALLPGYKPSQRLEACTLRQCPGNLYPLEEPYLSDRWAFVLDLNHLRYAYLRGRDFLLLRENAEDCTAEFLSDCAIDIDVFPAHTVFEDINAD